MPIKPKNYPRQDANNIKRKRIIANYRIMGYEKWDDAKGHMIADMFNIRMDMMALWGKDINNYTGAELSKIIAVIEEKLVPNYLKKKSETPSL